MSQADSTQTNQAEVLHLTQELQMRDQLVEQLSEELFRLIKGTGSAQRSQADSKALQSLQKQYQAVKQQLAYYREETTSRNLEIAQLRQSVQELSEHNCLLEQAIEELPEVYRQRFAERITPVKQKLVILQRENRQLQAKLQNVSYRLAVKMRYPDRVELPHFPKPAGTAPSLPERLSPRNSPTNPS